MNEYKCNKCGNVTMVCEPACSNCGAKMNCVCVACEGTCSPECQNAGCKCSTTEPTPADE